MNMQCLLMVKDSALFGCGCFVYHYRLGLQDFDCILSFEM